MKEGLDKDWLNDSMGRYSLPDLRPYTLKELYNLYGVSEGVMRRMLKSLKEELGPKLGHYFTVKQVQIIFNSLGPPQIFIENTGTGK